MVSHILRCTNSYPNALTYFLFLWEIRYQIHALLVRNCNTLQTVFFLSKRSLPFRGHIVSVPHFATYMTNNNWSYYIEPLFPNWSTYTSTHLICILNPYHFHFQINKYLFIDITSLVYIWKHLTKVYEEE